MRSENRANDALRPLVLTPHYIRDLPGSVLVEQGNTRVVCTASLEERVPPFLRNSGSGWITAEYSMLPGSCGRQRIARERLKIHNRHGEIQRFIGRALRAAVDLRRFGERSVLLDADVIQADGSTRCASLNGCFLAMLLAFRYLVYEQLIPDLPPVRLLAAVSLGVLDGEIRVDLDYPEDSSADMDMNVVSMEDKSLVEVQAFSEKKAVSRDYFQRMVDMACEKNLEIIARQREILNREGLL